MNKVSFLKQLEKDHQCWQDVYENRCNDSLWADGINLICNHIIHDKRQLKESMGENEVSQLYYKEYLQRVDHNYIVKPMGILEMTVQYYGWCTSLEKWNILENAFEFLDRKDSKQQSMRFFISRIIGLKIWDSIILNRWIYFKCRGMINA